MFENKIIITQNTASTALAFGVTEARKAEILKKLVAVAKLYPKYSIIAESFLNCTDRFTVNERLYGIFLLGKAKGAAQIMKATKTQVKVDAATMPREFLLLSLLSKDVYVENKFLTQFIK